MERRERWNESIRAFICLPPLAAAPSQSKSPLGPTTMALSRCSIASSVALIAFLLVSTVATEYKPDGKTVYCWVSPASANLTSLHGVEHSPVAFGASCRVNVTLQMSSRVNTRESVTVHWAISADAFTNRTTKWRYSAPGNSSSSPWKVEWKNSDPAARTVQSRLTWCTIDDDCDPFSIEHNRTRSTKVFSSTVSDGQAAFKATIGFQDEGVYSLFAHVVLPAVGSSGRFDFAIFTRLRSNRSSMVNDQPGAATMPPTSSQEDQASSSQISTVIIVLACVGTIVVIIVVIVIIFYRRKRKGTNPKGENQVDSDHEANQPETELASQEAVKPV